MYRTETEWLMLAESLREQAARTKGTKAEGLLWQAAEAEIEANRARRASARAA